MEHSPEGLTQEAACVKLLESIAYGLLRCETLSSSDLQGFAVLLIRLRTCLPDGVQASEAMQTRYVTIRHVYLRAIHPRQCPVGKHLDFAR